MLGDVAVNAEACRQAAADPLLLATDLADWLVKKGLPFRKAHHAIGAVVALAEKSDVPINELPVGELQKICPLLTREALGVFSIAKGLDARKMIGAPNPKLVYAQLMRWRKVFVIGITD
jgi:argininosuccinate lyase